MQTPSAGQTIRITALKPAMSTGIHVGQILTVGEDPRQPLTQYDGHTWVESTDKVSRGWVKWELVEVLTTVEVTEIRSLIGTLGSRETLLDGVKRYVAGVRSMRIADSDRLTDLNKRITVAEREVQRLSTPAGAAFTYRNGAPHSDETVKRVPQQAQQRDELHQRAGRQRREIRRLNQSQRLMRAERELLRRTNEDLVVKMVDQNKLIRMLESK